MTRARAFGALPLDEEAMRTLAARIVERTRNVASSMTNHFIAAEGLPVHSRVGDIRASTLVVHGTADPLFPFEHGEAVAAEIPGARLLPSKVSATSTRGPRRGTRSSPCSWSTRERVSGKASAL